MGGAGARPADEQRGRRDRRHQDKIPSRLDRLPWARFHWLIILGLGTAWILDGLEVTIVGTVGSRMTEAGSGISISTAQIGTAGAIYVAGACLGALFFGQLTDRFGRKKLFLWTLGLYLVATAATGASFSPWFFFVARFFTGAGIGGEYAAINSAIDELIPARARGRVDLVVNGSYWVGSAAGSAASLALLNTAWLPKDIGWRLGFALGVILALAVLLVRRHVPESPRWLFIHGREAEAEAIVGDIEHGVEEETGQPLPEVSRELTVRQRETIPFREIATAVRLSCTTRPPRCGVSPPFILRRPRSNSPTRPGSEARKPAAFQSSWHRICHRPRRRRGRWHPTSWD